MKEHEGEIKSQLRINGFKKSNVSNSELGNIENCITVDYRNKQTAQGIDCAAI